MGWKKLMWRERLMVNDPDEGFRLAGWIKPKKSLVTVCKKLLLQLRTEQDGKIRSGQQKHDVTILREQKGQERTAYSVL